MVHKGEGGESLSRWSDTQLPCVWSSTQANTYFRASFLFQLSLAETADNTQVTDRKKSLAQGKYKHS